MRKMLDELVPGEGGTVVSLKSDDKIKRRLLDMGLTPGAKVIMRKTAPMGDPIEINVRGYQLTLRKNEAKGVTVMTEDAVNA